MIKLKTLSHTPRRFPIVLLLAGLLTAARARGLRLGGSSTITVGNENKSDNALLKSTTKNEPSETSSNVAEDADQRAAVEKAGGNAAGGPPAPKKEVIKDLIVGTGAEAKAGQTVTMNYVGVNFKSGKEFDSSWKRNEPFTFTLGKK